MASLSQTGHGADKLDHVRQLLQQLEEDLTSHNLSTTDKEECMEKLKVYGRDPANAGPLYTLEGITILVEQAFLPATTRKASREALSCLANALLLRERTRRFLAQQDCWSPLIERMASLESHDQFLAARILFVLTYVDEGGLYQPVLDAQPLVHVITQKIEQHATQRKEQSDLKGITGMDEKALTDIAKLIFNITKFIPSSAASFSPAIPYLASLVATNQRQRQSHPPLQQPVSAVLNALLNLDTTSAEWTISIATTAPGTFLPSLIAIIDASTQHYDTSDLETLLTPLIALLSNLLASADQAIKSYMQQNLLPTEQDRAQVLGHSDSLPSRLLRLCNAPTAPMLASATAQLLYELSESDPDVFVRNVGLGYASGYLVSNGLPLPTQGGAGAAAGVGGLDGAAGVNPVTGQRWDAERKVDELPPMTEEEKEREAERLFVLFERLKATGVVDVKNPVEDMHRFEELPD